LSPADKYVQLERLNGMMRRDLEHLEREKDEFKDSEKEKTNQF
jgi:hypothetical protein